MIILLSSIPLLIIMVCVDLGKPDSGYDDQFKDIINN